MTHFHFPSYCFGMVTGAGMALFACSAAHADQGNPLAEMQAALCPPTAQTPWERAPQVWSGPRIEYANTLPNPQHGVIRYPAGGTGGSGGHSPEPEAPAPVDLPGAGGLLALAIGALGAWRMKA